MASILDWGIEVVLRVQQFSPGLDLPFRGITFLGSHEFFLLLVPLIFWCFDRRTGVRMVLLFLFSAYVNVAAKALADQPRPFSYDHRVKQLVRAGDGGFPSGHTQSTVVVWGYLACRYRRPLVWGIATLLIIGVPLSRVYLGVHFPTDLFGGYFLGGLILFSYGRIAPIAEAWLRQKGLIWQLGTAVFIPLALVVVNPEGGEHALVTCASLMGFATGIVLERRWIRFRCGGVWWKMLLRYVLGVAVLFGLLEGLGIGFSGLEPVPFYGFIRYAVAGLWGGLGAPCAFTWLKLADREAAMGHRS